MKALLMHRDRDFALEQELPWVESSLMQDLELSTLLSAMAGGDRFLFDVARKAILSGLRSDVDTVLYRQAIMRDCLKNPLVVRELYDLTVEAMERRRTGWLGIVSRSPSGILSDSIALLDMLVSMLHKLRNITRARADRFESEGFKAFFAMIEGELSDEYLAELRHHLAVLGFRQGVLLSAKLGEGNRGIDYMLRQEHQRRTGWLRRALDWRAPAYSFRLADRDQTGARILSEMRNCGLNLVANALAQSADHVRGFFEMLRTELAFYLGCLNLHQRLASKGEPMCFPRPVPAGERRHRFSGLYDPCLSLLMERRVVGNTVDADGTSLTIITGANQGGKSIFLRSIGLAQMMMQCGMFVAAESFEAELCTNVFTHYKREEDATMKYGKLDEELARLSDITDHLAPNAMLLCNESFAATNQREGSEIARQIVCALLQSRVKVFFVTHLYDFAHGMFDAEGEHALFLRAERRADGSRTFRLVEGEPLETSYGEDLYRELFPEGVENQGMNGLPSASDSTVRDRAHQGDSCVGFLLSGAHESSCGGTANHERLRRQETKMQES